MMVEKRKRSRYSELSSSRTVIYKLYRVMCKILGCEALCYGPLSKRTKDRPVIYAQFPGGEKIALAARVSAGRSVVLPLVLSKPPKSSDDVQKLVVKRILRALETRDVILDLAGRSSLPHRVLRRDLDFERHLVEEDLKRGCM